MIEIAVVLGLSATCQYPMSNSRTPTRLTKRRSGLVSKVKVLNGGNVPADVSQRGGKMMIKEVVSRFTTLRSLSLMSLLSDCGGLVPREGG